MVVGCGRTAEVQLRSLVAVRFVLFEDLAVDLRLPEQVLLIADLDVSMVADLADEPEDLLAVPETAEWLLSSLMAGSDSDSNHASRHVCSSCIELVAVVRETLLLAINASEDLLAMIRTIVAHPLRMIAAFSAELAQDSWVM